MRSSDPVYTSVVERLGRAGCVAAEEEATELIDSAEGDARVLEGFILRRTAGEPIEWIVGRVRFCGIELAITPGVYVPRWQSESLAQRSAMLLPDRGRAIDLGTGCGAIARVIAERHPAASVIGTEVDPLAATCARENGVDVAFGPLFSALRDDLRGTIDLVVGVLPYVPESKADLLPRDVVAFEPPGAIFGGPDGLAIVRQAVGESAEWLRRGGTLLLEVGSDQADALAFDLEAAGFAAPSVILDADGDLRGIEAVAVLRHL